MNEMFKIMFVCHHKNFEIQYFNTIFKLIRNLFFFNISIQIDN
jgi:hypothetical protein